MYSKTFGIAGLALSLFAVPAVGHHSFSMFDQTQFMNVTGTVTEFEWINPHAWLHISVTDESGTPRTWSFEGGNLGGLAAAGWRADSVAEGEQVEIGFHPMIDGARGGQLRTLVPPDGTKLCNGARFCEDGAQGAN
ncbi:MAG: DUF6152 family protein [Alphaproteobacteria bacterium]|jgi:hypothetical protein